MGGSILAPLLNRQALNAQVDISQSQRNQALYSYEKTVRNAFAEVNDSLDAITRYQEQLTELLAQQAVAQETLRIAQNRYRNGYSSYLDVLDAQRTLFSVQTSVVQVKTTCCWRKLICIKRWAAVGAVRENMPGGAAPYPAHMLSVGPVSAAPPGNGFSRRSAPSPARYAYPKSDTAYRAAGQRS